MNSMKTFDPEKRCRVHDELNDKIIEWLPRWATLYREYAVKHDEGVNRLGRSSPGRLDGSGFKSLTGGGRSGERTNKRRRAGIIRGRYSA
jgi:hypothetical protein